MHGVQEIPKNLGLQLQKAFNYYDKTGASMAAAEERSEFKFVFLQRINLKSNYKRDSNHLQEQRRERTIDSTEAIQKIIKYVHRESNTKKSSSENQKHFPARENQFKVQRISILN